MRQVEVTVEAESVFCVEDDRDLLVAGEGEIGRSGRVHDPSLLPARSWECWQKASIFSFTSSPGTTPPTMIVPGAASCTMPSGPMFERIRYVSSATWRNPSARP
ncbi:hypothetical protein [Nonomuraea sp. SYSU D8015]|uniref:hypothetical protein n=1 Tax=Nonomuraea sp. SYSU D8015 TaxID=2593644 RepID=UPI001660EE7D|nr:hypothetical protein [Nonomuraea sp. SYSU D8015]